MKKLLFYVLMVILAVGFMYSCNEPLTDTGNNDEMILKSGNASKNYIVVLNDAELNAELAIATDYDSKVLKAKNAGERIMKRHGITDLNVENSYGVAIKGFSVKMTHTQMLKLSEDPSVKYIEEDQMINLIVPDVKISASKSVSVTGQTIPWGITRVGGGGNFTGTNTAWIIDTGIDLDHPDLNVDKTRSKSFVNTKTADDDNGHGSHCAGIVAAKNNTVGVIGVAPGAKLVAVKVLTRSGSGTTSGVIKGIDYVAANGKTGDIANMSLGGGVSTTLDNAVINAASKGIKFVLAAGNETDDANNHSPARANGTNIYTISAMDNADKFAYFSNFGNPPIDYCAPGVSIYSCYKNAGYATMSGTSMATPHVTGILMWGSISSDGKVLNDPDGNADPIAHR